MFYENTGLLWVKWRTVIKLKWYDTLRTALDQRYKETRRASSHFVWTAYLLYLQLSLGVKSFIIRVTSNCPKVCIHILFCPAAIISLLLFFSFLFLFEKDVFVYRTAFYRWHKKNKTNVTVRHSSDIHNRWSPSLFLSGYCIVSCTSGRQNCCFAAQCEHRVFLKCHIWSETCRALSFVWHNITFVIHVGNDCVTI